jgi:hypothetical protein
VSFLRGNKARRPLFFSFFELKGVPQNPAFDVSPPEFFLKVVPVSSFTPIIVNTSVYPDLRAFRRELS